MVVKEEGDGDGVSGGEGNDGVGGGGRRWSSAEVDRMHVEVGGGQLW